jgi:hypothetical protein
MADIKPITVPAKRLSASITAAATTFKVDNITGWNGSDLTSSDLGSVAYASFRNSAGTLLEIVEIDPTTIASASITMNKRGLSFDGTDLTTETAASKLAWVKGDTIVEFGSHFPQLLGHYVDTIATQTISGVKTFSVLPAITAGDPVADNDVARKAYVDSVVAGSFPADRLVVAGNAGETVADGEILYFDETDNEWKLADASAAATAEGVLLGVAQGAGTDGAAITGGVLLKGVDDAQTGMTTGDVMYLSDTAGGVSSSAGTIEVNLGIAKSATELYFTPRFLHFLTEDQQDALGGSDGTPNVNNKYLTETDASNGVDQAQLTQDATVAVGEADATTKYNEIAQSFVATKNDIVGVTLSKQADTGSFTGTVVVALYADSSGPTGAALATVTISNAEWLVIPDDTPFGAIFSSAYATTPGTTYWIVVSPSTSDTSNHPNLGSNSAGGYADGSVMFNNVTDGWSAIATIDLYFQVLSDVRSRALRADSSGFIYAYPPYVTDAGTTDAYYIALPNYLSYTTGAVITFKATTANTAACTLDINSLGAKAIKKHNDVALDTGDIEAGQIVSVVYDGTDFQMLSQLASSTTISDIDFFIPQPLHASGPATLATANNAIFYCWMFYLPQAITVTSIDFDVSAVGTAGTVDFAVFSADGQTQHISVTTGSVSGTGLNTVAVSSVALAPGHYYFGHVTNSTTDITSNGYAAVGGSSSGILTGATGETHTAGRISVSAGAMPSSFDPTSDIDTNNDNKMAIRLQG